MQQAIAKLDQTALSKAAHWTAGKQVRLVLWIASDFIAQLETQIEQMPGFTHGDLAKRLNVSLGRVSQMMNSPGNFTLKNGCSYAGAVGLNVAMVTYPADCRNAPISGDVFRACWEVAGRPTNMFDVRDATVGFTSKSGWCGAAIGHAWPTAQTDARPVIVNTPIQGNSGNSGNNFISGR